jgi:transketolase
VRTIDGHDIAAIREAVQWAKGQAGRPAAIIANTVKGKGVPFMENQYLWHMKAPDAAEFKEAMEHLERQVRLYA